MTALTLADVEYAKKAAAEWYVGYAPVYLPMSDDDECAEWVEFVALQAFERESIDFEFSSLWRHFKRED